MLDIIHKGPLTLHPTGKWRIVEISLSEYSPQLHYIEFADSGSSENENTTRVSGSTIRLGHTPGSCMEIFSLPHLDSISSGERTCLIHLNLPNAHIHFQKWKIEWSRAHSEGSEGLHAEPHEFYAPIIGAKKIHHISLDIPTAAVDMKVFAIGNGFIKQEVGVGFLPSVESK